MQLLINLDVHDLATAEELYVRAFGLRRGRRLGDDVVELVGPQTVVYLLSRPEGSAGAGAQPRSYARHWMPCHLDVVVEDLDAALLRVEAAGFLREGPVREERWGRIAQLADPFGHGWCLLQFLNRGYDELTR